MTLDGLQERVRVGICGKNGVFPVYVTTLPSPVGRLLLTSDGVALTGLWLEGQKRFPALPEDAEEAAALSVFLETAAWLDAYFAGRVPPVLPRLAPRGTPFQQAVWHRLAEIPFGKTVTYGAIADALRQHGISASAQAVGGAVGRNPIAILIPCYRVVGVDGSLTGYAGGLEVKRKLLALEGAR